MIVYTQENCPACVILKAKLDKTGTEYVTVKIGEDITKEEFFKLYPNVRSVPFVVTSK